MGGPKRALSGAKNPIGILAGQYFDEETGLHYNYHRYYDPHTGRYLTPDPIGLAGGINLSAYALNNPVNNYDPDGRLVITVPTLLIGGAIAIAAAYYGAKAIDDAAKLIKEKPWQDEVDYDNWPTGQEYFYPKPPDPEEEKRKKAEDGCFDECADEMSGDPCSQGTPFTNCMKRCMRRHGYSYP